MILLAPPFSLQAACSRSRSEDDVNITAVVVAAAEWAVNQTLPRGPDTGEGVI